MFVVPPNTHVYVMRTQNGKKNIYVHKMPELHDGLLLGWQISVRRYKTVFPHLVDETNEKSNKHKFSRRSYRVT